MERNGILSRIADTKILDMLNAVASGQDRREKPWITLAAQQETKRLKKKKHHGQKCTMD